MRRILTMLAIIAALAGARIAWTCGGYGSHEITRALAGDAAQRAEAVSALRETGPAGLQEVIALRDLRASQLTQAAPANVERIQADIAKLNDLIDEVGGAKYCSASQLYWYTDFEKAQAEAARTNKPILCLRMLGKLNEEFSCANSRFFRTTLYANQEISQTLREKFVLHWESVRPVPRVTIDFGDGRKLERTLTGNSIHYVVDQDGRPLDGLPGLYGPQAFHEWLARAEALARDYAGTPADERDNVLQQYHRERLAAVRAAFAEDLAKVGGKAPATADGQLGPRPTPPTAREAALIARPKRVLELPVINAVASESVLPTRMEDLDEQTWTKIAALHAEEAVLDEASVALIGRQSPSAVIAGLLSVGKARVEDPLARLVRNFQTSAALDTVRNEYILHRQLHEWYINGEADRAVHPLNERVYAQLFLTPSSDPWLGLKAPDTYSALSNDGVVVEPMPGAE